MPNYRHNEIQFQLSWLRKIDLNDQFNHEILEMNYYVTGNYWHQRIRCNDNYNYPSIWANQPVGQSWWCPILDLETLLSSQCIVHHYSTNKEKTNISKCGKWTLSGIIAIKLVNAIITHHKWEEWRLMEAASECCLFSFMNNGDDDRLVIKFLFKPTRAMS